LSFLNASPQVPGPERLEQYALDLILETVSEKARFSSYRLKSARHTYGTTGVTDFA
jgi:hypothetical protein